MLDRIENFDTKEPSDTTGYTIEHVLPQNERLNRQWKDMLGPQFKDIQSTWVHRLGNLTLTGYNSTYSDRPFEEKKSIKGGFNESAVRLNKFVREREGWTAAEIEARGKLLADIAGKAWPPLRVSAEELKEVRRAHLQREAGRMQLVQVSMEPYVRQLFDALRPDLLALAPDIIEVPRGNSVSYYAHDGDYFVEAIPRRRRLTLLLNLSLSECTYRDENMSDATDWKFIVNAEHDGGVMYRLKAPDQIDAAMKLIRQAHELAAQ
jgi:predicted transport protein